MSVPTSVSSARVTSTRYCWMTTAPAWLSSVISVSEFSVALNRSTLRPARVTFLLLWRRGPRLFFIAGSFLRTHGTLATFLHRYGTTRARSGRHASSCSCHLPSSSCRTSTTAAALVRGGRIRRGCSPPKCLMILFTARLTLYRTVRSGTSIVVAMRLTSLPPAANRSHRSHLSACWREANPARTSASMA